MLPLTGGAIASYWSIAQDNDLHIKLIVWDQELRTFLIAPLVQLDRMSDYESDGRGFEPPKEYFYYLESKTYTSETISTDKKRDS